MTNTIHLTLKMTSAQVVETSLTNNSSFQNYTHPDDHTTQTTDTPGLKPFTTLPRISSKNAPLSVVFSTIFSVFGYPYETLSFVFDILLKRKLAVLTER